MKDNQPSENFVPKKIFGVDKIRKIYLNALCRHINKLRELDNASLLRKLSGSRRTKFSAINRMKKGFLYVCWWR